MIPRRVETHGLPKGKEDDQLDTQHFQEWLVLRQLVLQLEVKLNKAEHRDRNRHGFEDLHPYVRKCGRQAVFAVDVEDLRNDRDDTKQYSDQAVLEDADPDNLSP